jgi:hypothetical protein
LLHGNQCGRIGVTKKKILIFNPFAFLVSFHVISVIFTLSGTIMKNALIGIFFSLLAILPLCSHAGDLASLSIVSQQTGEPMKIWRHSGHNYIVGTSGQRYALQLRNKTGERLLSVVAVDGINVITGATASPQQSGYVLDAWQLQDIAGWRKNMQQVAAFYFNEMADSYAARTGRAEQAGVIGIALYREKSQITLDYPPISKYPSATMDDKGARSSRSGGDMNGSLSPTRDAETKLGTGHGERVTSHSRTTEFQRATSTPSEVLTVYYDSYANLLARGIIPRYLSSEKTPLHPSPFPGPFVPDPR